VDALSSVVAVEEGPHGVRSNVISPGAIADTEGMDRLSVREVSFYIFLHLPDLLITKIGPQARRITLPARPPGIDRGRCKRDDIPLQPRGLVHHGAGPPR
jgi:NAD(P)-dependent dehydrogenase (short-subunit alcohol dehydrogenase family)